MNNKDHIDVAKSVLEKVKKGDVHMRARWKFVVDAIGMDAFLLLLLAAAAFALGLVLHYWRVNALADYFAFGQVGVRRVLLLIPVEMLVVSGALVLIAAVFVRHMDCGGYKQSAIAWIVVGVVLVGGMGVATYSVHGRIETAAEGRLPFFLERYYPSPSYGMPRPHTLAEVIAVQQQEVTVQYVDNTLARFNRERVLLRPRDARLEKGVTVRLFNDDGEVWGVMVISREHFDRRVEMFHHMGGVL